MVSQRLRSISSVLGGKNSKEMFGDFSARCPSGAGTANSDMTRKTPGKCGQQAYRETAKISQTPNTKQPIGCGNWPTMRIICVQRCAKIRRWAVKVTKLSNCNIKYY